MMDYDPCNGNVDALQQARRRGEQMREEMLREAGGTVSVSEAAKRLGISEAAVTKQVLRGDLIGMAEGDGYMIPACQIIHGAVLPGLPRVLHAMSIQSPWMQLNWLLCPESRLEHERPINWLRERKNLDQIARVAAMEGEHGAS